MGLCEVALQPSKSVGSGQDTKASATALTQAGPYLRDSWSSRASTKVCARSLTHSLAHSLRQDPTSKQDSWSSRASTKVCARSLSHSLNHSLTCSLSHSGRTLPPRQLVLLAAHRAFAHGRGSLRKLAELVKDLQAILLSNLNDEAVDLLLRCGQCSGRAHRILHHLRRHLFWAVWPQTPPWHHEAHCDHFVFAVDMCGTHMCSCEGQG